MSFEPFTTVAMVFGIALPVPFVIPYPRRLRRAGWSTRQLLALSFLPPLAQAAVLLGSLAWTPLELPSAYLLSTSGFLLGALVTWVLLWRAGRPSGAPTEF